MANLSEQTIIIEKDKEYISCPRCGRTIVPKRAEIRKTVKDEEGNFNIENHSSHYCPLCYTKLTIKREM